MHCHSHILIRFVEQCCTVFASSEASKHSTGQIHVIKLPDVGSVLSSVHALDKSANFVILLTTLRVNFDQKLVSGLFLGNVLGWCRGVSTSMVSLFV